MLPSTDLKASAPRIIAFSVLHSPAHPYRYRRFACPLAGTDARLAEERGSVTPSLQRTFTSYLLPVRLAHQIPASALTHRAPPSGLDDEPLGWPWVADAGLGPVGSGEGIDVLPFGTISLGTPPKGTHEQPLALGHKPLQALDAPGDGIVGEPAIDNSPKPLGRLVPVVVPPHAQCLLDPPQGAADPFAGRFATDPEPALLRLITEVRHAEEVERLRLALPRCRRFTLANRPNSMSRVLSGCSSSP